MDDATNYHLLKALEANPELTQRDLAREMGFSLGKTNYCLRALMDKGLLKARNFKNAKNRSTYAYILTPKGVEEKARVTYRFLKISANQRDQRLTSSPSASWIPDPRLRK